MPLIDESVLFVRAFRDSHFTYCGAFDTPNFLERGVGGERLFYACGATGVAGGEEVEKGWREYGDRWES